MPFSPESQLRRTENILASISDCFFALDSQWRFVYLNPQAQEFLGRPAQQLLGQVLWDALPHFRGTTTEREFRRVREDGGRSNFVVQSFDGRWIEHTIYARGDDAELPEAGGGISVYFRDVTDRRRNAQATRERDEFYRLLVENAREYSIIALDVDGRITHWNEGARRIFGWSEDEVRGEDGELIFTPQDRENGAPQLEIETARREGRAQDERWHLKKDGSQFWAEGAVMALGFEEGRVRGFVKILRDNTEKRAAQDAARQTEERLQRVSDATGIALWTWEPVRDVFPYKHALDVLHGFKVQSFAAFAPHVHPDDLETVRGEFARLLETGRTVQLVYRTSPRPGQMPWQWVQSIVSLDQTENGEPLLLGVSSDVSERVAAQSALEESRARLETVVHETGVALWSWNATIDELIEELNLETVTGVSPFSMDALRAAFHPGDWPRVEQTVKSAMERGEGYEVEHRLARRPNANPARPEEWKWLSAKAGVSFSEKGEAIFSGFVFDISARRQSELALAQSRERLENVVRETGVALWLWDPGNDRIIEQVNLDEIFESPELDLKATLTRTHPADHAELIAVLKDAVQARHPYEVEFRLRRRTGEGNPSVASDWKWVLVTGTPRVEEDGVVLMSGFAFDISSRKEAELSRRASEKRYSALVRASATIVWHATADLESVEAAGWAAFTGAPDDRIDNFSWVNTLHPDDRERVRAQWQTLLERPQTAEIRHRLRDSADRYRHVLVRAVPLFEDDGETLHEWIGTITDVHERTIADELRELFLEEEQRARQTAEEARAEAERANKMKDEFLAVVSHELRTPLNAILGWSNILQSGELSPETAREGLAVIERNARAQAQIVEDILDVARVVTGKLKVEARPLDLETVAREALEATQTAATQRGVIFRSELVSLPVEGEAIRLRQMLWNLLSNAIKFSPPGGHVELTMSRSGNNARIEVRDEGAGIAPEFLPHVFERFRQADSSSTRRHGGLGLGLALVRSIAQAHGGHVEARSEGLGKGATFVVELPLSERARQAPVEVAPKTVGRLAGVSIVVCDDAPDTLEFTALLLRREGARVSLASSASQAQMTLQNGGFDVLLSDLAMPDQDGYELLEWVKSNIPNLPVVAMTAYAGTIETERARDAGFAGFVAKPIEAEVLVETVEGVLGRK